MSVAEEAGRPSAQERVSTLELFFDLVFVFTITQLTSVLVRMPTWRGLAQVVLMLGLIWWMYGGYAWLTNAVAPDRATRRLLLLGGMCGYFVLALAVPHAFSGSGLTFGLAYLVVVCVHAGLFIRSSAESVARTFIGLAPWNIATALMVVAGGAIGGSAQYALWTAAFVIEWGSPKLTSDEGYDVGPAHFVERHGLVVLVAIGESVVAVGIGASSLKVDAELAGIAVLGLLLSACLWWAYFGGDDEAAERALTAAPARARPALALDAFGYWHIPILLGIVAVASGLERATAHPFHDLPFARSLALAGGVALYMAGDVLFRRRLAIGRSGLRATAAAAALATIPLGTRVSAALQIAALVALLAAALGGERSAARGALS